MPVITAAIDPISRIEGHLKVEVDIDTVNGVQQVVEARSTGTLFRGFERILEGRDPRDAPLITSRICGVCPTAHSQAAVLMLDEAFSVTPPTTGRLLRNLVHAACFLESDILHFYLLCLLDFIKGPGMAPWQPGWDVGRRLDRQTEERFIAHYIQAIEVRRKVHEMGAIYGGKLPHTPAFLPGGFSAVSTAQNKADFQAYLTELTTFIESVYIPDVELLTSIFDDYLSIGKGYGNLLSFGVFRENDSGTSLLFDRGRMLDGGSVQPVDIGQITEHVGYSWYEDSDDRKHPGSADTLPRHPKTDAYSWLKAPRYNDVNYEAGPIARMMVNGDYSNGVSVMDRHRARALEALKIAQAMQGWLTALPVGVSGVATYSMPESATVEGLTEAPRGALGHWMTIEGGQIGRYQVITPTCWNCSPKDSNGNRGPMEEALIGTPVAKADEPIEVLRVVHSFDPCLDCATHVFQPGRKSHVVVTRFGTEVVES